MFIGLLVEPFYGEEFLQNGEGENRKILDIFENRRQDNLQKLPLENELYKKSIGRVFLSSFYPILFGILIIVFSQQKLLANERNNGDVHVRFSNNKIILDLKYQTNNQYKQFFIEKPDRLVIDLAHNRKITISHDALPSNLISSIRSSYDGKNNNRIVFDLKQKIDITKKSLLEPSNDKKYHRLVIDYKLNNQITKDAFDNLLNQINSDQSLVENTIANKVENKIEKKAEVNKKIKVNNLPVKKPDINNLTKNIFAHNKPIKKPEQRKKYIIVIDAGHGGKDPGAIGFSGTKEKDLTLLYTKLIKSHLDKTKRYEVYLTRDKDIFLTLGERVRIAQKLNADIFISVHADSNPNKQTKGFSVYTLSEIASDREAQRLARKENAAGFSSKIHLEKEQKEIAGFLVGLQRRKNMNYSSIFANILVEEMSKEIEAVNRAHRFAGFMVLKNPDSASILVELGYLSNQHNERLLNDKKYQNKIAKTFVIAIDKFFDNNN